MLPAIGVAVLQYVYGVVVRSVSVVMQIANVLVVLTLYKVVVANPLTTKLVLGNTVPVLVLNRTGMPLSMVQVLLCPELLVVKSTISAVGHDCVGHNGDGAVVNLKYGI